jgi:hypothetical protein
MGWSDKLESFDGKIGIRCKVGAFFSPTSQREVARLFLLRALFGGAFRFHLSDAVL